MDKRLNAARLLFVLLAASAVAGGSPARAASLGVQLGVDGCGVDGDVPPNSEYTNKAGLIAGIQGEVGFAHGLLLSLQPSYVQKKAGILVAPTTRGGSQTELELSFDYFSVPAVVKFPMASGRTYVAGGVSADFLSAAKLSGQGSDRDVKSTFNSTDFGAILGFGVVFPRGSSSFTTELRVAQGLSNLTTGNAAAAAGALAARLHSYGLQLIAGYLFPIGRP